DTEQLLPWSVRPLIDPSGQPLLPTLVPLGQVRGDELVLGAEAGVQRLLGHPGGRGDGFDPDRMDALLVKERAGDVEDTSPGGREGVRRLRHGGEYTHRWVDIRERECSTQ